jgi:hypothetical protein
MLAAPAAFATPASASLTIYHADNDALFSGRSQGTLNDGHALVHERRERDVRAGPQELRIDGLPATTEPETMIVAFDPASGIDLLGLQLRVSHPMADAVGRPVDVVPDGSGSAPVHGTLLGWSSGDGVLLRTADGKVHLLRRYTSMTLPDGATVDRATLHLRVDAKSAGRRGIGLTYMTSGLGWRAAYTATLAGGSACRMQFDPQASIANRSGRDYRGADIKLVAGQANLGNPGVRMYRMAAPAPMAAAEQAMPQQAALGDYRSFTLAGAVDLPNGTVTLTPLYPVQSVSCERQYIVEDGNAYVPPKPMTNDQGARDYRDRAIVSTLSFTAPDALPAGTLRAWTTDHGGTPALLGEGGVADTPKGKRVAVELGQSFDLRASRERTAFHVDIKTHSMSESYRITLSNGGDSARTVTVREHPNRWRTWQVTSSSLKPSKQTPQLLEFKVPVSAQGRATLDYTVQYDWTAHDL